MNSRAYEKGRRIYYQVFNEDFALIINHADGIAFWFPHWGEC